MFDTLRVAKEQAVLTVQIAAPPMNLLQAGFGDRDAELSFGRLLGELARR